MTTITTANAAVIDAIKTALNELMTRSVATGVRTMPGTARDETDRSLRDIFGARSAGLAGEHDAARADYVAAWTALQATIGDDRSADDAAAAWTAAVELEQRLDHSITDGELR